MSTWEAMLAFMLGLDSDRGVIRTDVGREAASKFKLFLTSLCDDRWDSTSKSIFWKLSDARRNDP